MTERTPSKERSTPVQVVRSVVVCLADPDTLWNQFARSTPDQQVESLRIMMVVKGDPESGFRLTFPGGKLNPYENPSVAAYREMYEETANIPWAAPIPIGRWRYNLKNRRPRQVQLMLQPVAPADPEGVAIGDPKVKGIISLTLSQLETLVTTGQLEVVFNQTTHSMLLESHLSLTPQEDGLVEMSPEESEQQELALQGLLTRLRHLEDYATRQLGRFREQALKQENPPQYFVDRYQRWVSHFMHNCLKQSFPERLRRSLDLPSHLANGTLGLPTLLYLPDIAGKLDWPGLDEAPEEVRLFVKLCQRALDQAGVDRETQVNSLVEEYNITTALEEALRQVIKEVFQVDDGQITQAMDSANSFLNYFLNSLKLADDNLRQNGVYQDWQLHPNVLNAGLGDLLALLAGIVLPSHHINTISRARFEAGRQILLVLKSLAVGPYYQELVSKIESPGYLRQAFNTFIQSTGQERVIKLPSGELHVPLGQFVPNVNHPLLPQVIIIDLRPIKSFSSFLRKAFLEPVHTIWDIFSAAIIIPTPQIRPHIVRIHQAQQIGSAFLDYLQQLYPNGRIQTLRKSTYGTDDYEKLLQGQFVEVTTHGRRAGSQSSRMVRIKWIIQLTLGDHQETMELVVYPFETIGGTFMGWLEKMRDDPNYAVRRSLGPIKGLPSMYDLLFPHDLYPQHYYQRLLSGYHQ